MQSSVVLWAVEHKRFTTIRRFLENGADINTDRIFRTYVQKKLHVDIEQGEYQFQQWRPTLKWHPLSIFTPLALAATLGLDSMVAFLLDHGADIEKPGKGLCQCCVGRNQFWLSFPPKKNRGRTEDESWMMDDEVGNCWTPLHFALCCDHESTVMLLLDRGANPQVTCPCESGPWNALHTATRLNQRRIIDHLLDNELVDINEGGFQGLTPLLIAYYGEHYSLVDMYIDRGADINAVWDSPDGGWTIFGMACLREDFSRASDLLQRGADPDFILTEEDYGSEWTALGLIYGNLFGQFMRQMDFISIESCTTQTRARWTLEQQIVQAKVDKALLQQREENKE